MWGAEFALRQTVMGRFVAVRLEGEVGARMLVAILMVLVVVGSLLFHFLSPWRATPIASNWGFIDDTMALTFWITGVGFVAVVLFMAYCLYRFRHLPGRRSAYEPENQKLEAWLAGITTVAVVILLAPGLFVWGQYITVPEGAMEVEAIGVQWNWTFRLPGADNKLGSSDVRYISSDNSMGVAPADPKGRDDLIVSSGDLHLPIGRPVKVLLRSIDVLHDFYVPEIRAKMDLVPGIVTYFWFTPTKIGEFEILCAAYCGNGHPQMRGKLIVESEAAYAAWLNQQQTFSSTQKPAENNGPQPAKAEPEKPELAKPEAVTPEPPKAEPAKPEEGKAEPEKNEPQAAAKPEESKPEATQPEAAKPEEGKAAGEEPKTDR
jgi:cytochrome c oxidase subunit 2